MKKIKLAIVFIILICYTNLKLKKVNNIESDYIREKINLNLDEYSMYSIEYPFFSVFKKTEPYGSTVFDINGNQLIDWFDLVYIRDGIIFAKNILENSNVEPITEVFYFDLKSKKKIVDFKIYTGTLFYDGLCAIQKEKNGNIFLMNKSGDIVDEIYNDKYSIAYYEFLYCYRYNILRLYDDEFGESASNVTLLNTKTKEYTTLPYLETSFFFNGRAAVKTIEDEDNVGFNFINTDLKTIFEKPYSFDDLVLSSFNHNFFIAENKNEYLNQIIYDYKGNVVIKNINVIYVNSNYICFYNEFNNLILKNLNDFKEKTINTDKPIDFYSDYIIIGDENFSLFDFDLKPIATNIQEIISTGNQYINHDPLICEQPTNLKVRGFKSQFTRLSNSK